MKDLDIEFDMWVPMLISFVGKTYVDTTPTLLWRQHENNSSGNYLQRKTLGYLIKKILKFLSKNNLNNIIHKYICLSQFIIPQFEHKSKTKEYRILDLWSKARSDSYKSRFILAVSFQWMHWSKLMNLYIRLNLLLPFRKMNF